MSAKMLRSRGVAVGLSALMAGTVVGLASPATAAPNSAVTSKTIQIGLPYIDLSSLGSVGVKLNQGSYPDAYNALVANINAHGGINGRKLSVVFGSVNPTNTTSSLAVCTKLTEDTPVFLAMSPYMPSCYLVDHETPTINATLPSAVPKSAAQNFTLTPPPTAYDPLQLSVFAKMGLLKGKTVGIIGAKQNDVQEVGVVQSTLKKLHVKVAQVGITTAQPSDQAALDQQVTAFVQKFQSAGVNEVIAVGSSSGTWPVALTNTQSSYNPPWIATSEVTISGTLNSVAPQYLKGHDHFNGNAHLRSGLDGSTHSAVRQDHQEGVSFHHHLCARQCDGPQLRGSRVRLSEPGDVHQDRRCGREEAHGGVIHQGWVRASQRHIPRVGRPRVVWARTVLCDRARLRGEIQQRDETDRHLDQVSNLLGRVADGMISSIYTDS